MAVQTGTRAQHTKNPLHNLSWHKIAVHKQPKTNLIMDSDENCSICYRKYGLQSNGIFLCKDGHSNSDYITTCEHWFCCNCIDKFYIEQVYNCPICNENWLQWIKSRHFYLYHNDDDDDDNEDVNADDNNNEDVNADDNNNEDVNVDDNGDVNADDNNNEDVNVDDNGDVNADDDDNGDVNADDDDNDDADDDDNEDADDDDNEDANENNVRICTCQN